MEFSMQHLPREPAFQQDESGGIKDCPALAVDGAILFFLARHPGFGEFTDIPETDILAMI
jgi:hypothetical protein